MLRFRVSKKKNSEDTSTTDFEVEDIEEAYALGEKWKGAPAVRKLEVERPPELEDRGEHTARTWIFERRAGGILASLKRWFVGKREGR